jgi:2-polyprenyl-3-methyl-5-hydroxy-6-metoxy-1,4-benzoquinol methylase
VRVLDVGCGSGEQLLDFLASFPRAHGVGVDLSAPNIEAARRQAESAGTADRVHFVQADYLELDTGAFDVITSDSVLQWIPAGGPTVFTKIARDLTDTGIVIATLPMECRYNSALAAARRAAVRLRGPRLDALALVAARALHPRWDIDLLRQRVEYLYMLPTMYGGDDLRRTCADAGLDWLHWEPLPHASPAQMKHGLLVARRSA